MEVPLVAGVASDLLMFWELRMLFKRCSWTKRCQGLQCVYVLFVDAPYDVHGLLVALELFVKDFHSGSCQEQSGPLLCGSPRRSDRLTSGDLRAAICVAAAA